jgi:hypothetical protein
VRADHCLPWRKSQAGVRQHFSVGSESQHVSQWTGFALARFLTLSTGVV